MTGFVVSYDLKSTSPDPHSEFLTQAYALGWFAYLKDSKGVWNRLPNTTLVGNFDNVQAADAAFMKVAEATRAKNYTVVLEKYFLTAYSGGIIVSDEKKTT